MMRSQSPQFGLAHESKEFLDWLTAWSMNLVPLSLAEAIEDPTRTAVCSVDMLNGFCYEGALSSPRAASRVDAIADIYQRAYERGVRHFISVQEWHSEQAEEFKAYGAHCIQGTREAELVPELASLPFAGDFQVVYKNSLHTIVGTTMEQWLSQHSQVGTFIVTGVCTDLCTYDMAMDLKLRANSSDLLRRVIVPSNAVDTYDLPVDAAIKIGALPHDANLLHAVFLYMMALNKIEVVKELT